MSVHTEPTLLTKVIFKNILESHPGVVRRLVRPKACEGSITSNFSFKKHREGRMPSCRNHAYWVWRPLKTWRWNKYSKPPTMRLCWSHLMYRGVWGGMEEEARTERWLQKLGYETRFMRDNRVRSKEKQTS